MKCLDNSECIILLTACINPNGMAFTALQDKDLRLYQYKAALNWYLKKTSVKIVFVENTGFNIAPMFEEYINNGRLEVLSFKGNDYDKSRGKGYGEGLILKYAVENSIFMKTSKVMIKVTGRFIIKNLNAIMRNYTMRTIQADKALFNGRLYCRSRLFISPTSFVRDYLVPRIDTIDDSKNYYFEHLLYDTSLFCKKDTGCAMMEFCRPPLYYGTDGSSGSLINPGIIYKIKWYCYHLLHCMNLYRNLVTIDYK